VIDQLQVVKKAMMAELLTRAPGRHKMLKQTEIGQVPEGGKLRHLANLLSSGPDNGLYKHLSAYGRACALCVSMLLQRGDCGRR